MAVKKAIEWAGDKDNCGHCAAAGDFLSAKEVKRVLAQNKYYRVDTPKGEKILEAADSDSIPTAKICDVTRGGKKTNCHYITGFSETEWKKELGLQ